MIQRNYYLDRLIRNMWNGEIKVITGIRRCGKSVLLFELFDEYLRNHGTDATQIIKIVLDQRRYYKYRNPITLCEYVEQLVLGQQDKKLYLFIDEVQLTAKVIDQENGGIEVTIYDMLNELKAYKNLDVYVTGSNSKGLSNDIATEFRGRATQIHVFPLCFEEYYSFVGGDEQKALDTYMLYGGMPRLLSMQDDKDKKDYLSSLYTELYVKDIVERNGIEREDILNDILNFLASQISSLTNPTNIANAIASMKNEKVNPALVSNYVQDIVDSFLISVAKRYDVKGKTYFNYPNKYYYTDIGLRNARLNYRQYDPGMVGIIHRGEDSRLFTSDADGCRKLAFGMRGVALGGIVAAAGLAGRIAVRLRNPERLIRMVLRLESLLGMRRVVDIPAIAGLGMELLTELALSVTLPRDERLEQAVNLFAINVPNRISVSRIAASCHVSPATLGRLFRQEFGRSPQAYFRDLRMQTARGLLADPAMPVKHVAAQVGFSDVFSFSREFRKAEGISPREFRRRLSEARPERNPDDRLG